MRYLSLAACLIVAGLTVVSTVAQETKDEPKFEVKLISTEENLLSQEIWGKWTLHEDITKFIAEGERTELTEFEIEKDVAASDRITKAIADFNDSGKERKHDGITRAVIEAARTVFCAGKLSGKKDGKTTELPFALTCAHGSPLLIVVYNDDLAATHVSFVRDPDGDSDLLFVGGDRPTEHFRCFKRAQYDKDG